MLPQWSGMEDRKMKNCGHTTRVWILLPVLKVTDTTADWLNLCWSSQTCSWFPRWPWWGWAACCYGTEWSWWTAFLSAAASRPPALSLHSRADVKQRPGRTPCYLTSDSDWLLITIVYIRVCQCTNICMCCIKDTLWDQVSSGGGSRSFTQVKVESKKIQ